MTFWHLLMEIVLLLGTPFVLGAAAQRLKQSALAGRSPDITAIPKSDAP